MASSTVVSSWLEDCKSIAAECLSLGLETSKLVHGWQVTDKLRMDDMIQSMYHMSWNMKDIGANIDEIARTEVMATRQYTIEEIQYPDMAEVDVKELEDRTRAWYTDCENLYAILVKLVRSVQALGFDPRTVRVLTNRIRLDLDFFKRQYEKSGGRLL